MISGRRQVDWTQIRQRLAATQQRLEQSWAPTAAERIKILEERAIRLGREPESPETGTDRIVTVEFLLGYERYGIETAFVREVYPLMELTPLPGTPDFIVGIANVRGNILSIIDIKRLFDLPAKGLTDLNKVIIVRCAEMELGILADELLGVRSVRLADLQPPLPTLTGSRADYLRGLTDDRLAVLDVERMFSDKRLVVDDRAEKGG